MIVLYYQIRKEVIIMASQFGLRVGNNIRNYRLAKGMSMRELAGKVGLTEATIQKYETGAIKTLDVSMLMKFAEALNIPPEDVVGWDKVEKRNDESMEVMKKYNLLTDGHKKAVLDLINNLIQCQS